MKIKRFEDIESWKEARDLVRDIYNIFRVVTDYGFKDQVQRAAVSVMTNIAEGFDRGTNKEFIYYLKIARGSISEVRSLMYIALEVYYIEQNTFDRIFEKCTKITSLINGFIRYLKIPV